MPLSANKFRNTIILSVPFRTVVFWKVGNAKWRVDGEWFVARGNSKTEGERKSEVARQEHPKREEISPGSLAWKIEQHARVSAPSPADLGPNGARTRSDYRRRVLKDQRAYTFPGQTRARGWLVGNAYEGGIRGKLFRAVDLAFFLLVRLVGSIERPVELINSSRAIPGR